MTSKPTSFWDRLVKAIKTDSSSSNPHKVPEASNKNDVPAPSKDSAHQTNELPTEPSGGPLSRWNRREQTIAQLQQGYKHVTEVVEDIQKHLISQGERTDRIATSLEQLQRALNDMPAIARQQAETLAAIADRIETASLRTQQLTEAVNEIPAVARTQANTLANINLQLEKTGEQDKATSEAMNKLGTAVIALGEANTAQVQTIRMMNAKTDKHNQQLSVLIAKQSKRFMLLFIVTVILAAAAVATTIVGIAIK